MNARRAANGSAAGRSAAARPTTARQKRRQRQTRLPLCAVTSSLHRFMDYTVSLQHQLAVFPTHVYQGYSVELQVLSSRLWLLPLPPLCAERRGAPAEFRFRLFSW